MPLVERNVDAGTIVFEDPANGQLTESSRHWRLHLLQWTDWAMRWHALSVDYEMSGKDLIDSVKVSARITKILEPRTGRFQYELFLDEQGQKISESKAMVSRLKNSCATSPKKRLATSCGSALGCREEALV